MPVALNIVAGDLGIFTGVTFQNSVGKSPVWQNYGIQGDGPGEVLVVYHSHNKNQS